LTKIEVKHPREGMGSGSERSDEADWLQTHAVQHLLHYVSLIAGFLLLDSRVRQLGDEIHVGTSNLHWAICVPISALTDRQITEFAASLDR